MDPEYNNLEYMLRGGNNYREYGNRVCFFKLYNGNAYFNTVME